MLFRSRYPDIIIHRLVDKYIKNGTIPEEDWGEYEIIANYTSEREKDATDAERGSIKYKQTEYMSSHVGQEFKGIISGLSQWGMFVQEKETKSEGMIRMKDIGNDFFSYYEDDMVIRGQKTNQEFHVGDIIKIKVLNTDINKRIIDYGLIQDK